MKIAIRKEPNGLIYIDKDIYNDERFTEEELTKAPYNYTKVEIEDKYKDCIATDFNENLTFSIEKYKARKEREIRASYEEKIVEKIRERYNINQELSILRQQATKPEEFEEYSSYVEMCKTEVKKEISSKII